MLNLGAGVGPMLNSASCNSQLAMKYEEAASDVEALLGEVWSWGWQGQAAEAFVAACLPFLTWLMKTAAVCIEVATQQEVVAAAYTVAVAAMPTQLELAANRVMREVLAATNFFGVNAIPIAINEEEYVQMWVRAATTMATYSAISQSALASTPQTGAPPLILKSDAQLDNGEEAFFHDGHGHGGHSHGGHASVIDNAFAEILRNVSAGRLVWDPLHGTLNGLDYDDYVFSGNPMWWLARGLEFFQDGEQFWELLFIDPTAAFRFLLYILVLDWPTHIAQLAPWLAESPQLLAVALGGTSASLGVVAGLAGLSGPGTFPSAVVPTLAPVAAVPAMLAVTGGVPAIVAPGSPPTSASTPASAPASVISAATAAPAPPAVGFGDFPSYFVGGGGPGIGFGSGQSAYTNASASASDSTAAEAAVQASARNQARARRRRRSATEERVHRQEPMTMDTGFDVVGSSPEDRPDARTSDRGAGFFGFAGTVRQETVVEVAGLTTLVGDDFGGSPTMPMVPGTWGPDQKAIDEVR